MRIQAKIIGLLLAMAFVFAIAFSFHNHISWTTLNLLLEEAQEQKSETFDKLVALKNKSQEVLGIDYTYWDEMVAFAENPTSEWVEQNLRSALSVYNVNAIWILNANFDYVCAIDSVDGNALKKLPFTNEEIKEFFADSPFCHFFIDTPWDLWRYGAARYTLRLTSNVRL